MKKILLKAIGIILIIAGVIIPTYLAIIKIISETLFGLILLGFLGAGFLIYKLDEIVEFEVRGLKLKTLQKEVFAKSEELKVLSNKLDEDRSQLRKSTKIFIETLYLTLETRNRFPIPKPAADEITKNLNLLANVSIEGEKEDKEWRKRIKDIQNLLEQVQK